MSRNLADLHASLSVPKYTFYSIETWDSGGNQIRDKIVRYFHSWSARSRCLQKDFADGCCIFISTEINVPHVRAFNARFRYIDGFERSIACGRNRFLSIPGEFVWLNTGYRRKNYQCVKWKIYFILQYGDFIFITIAINNRFFDKFSVNSLTKKLIKVIYLELHNIKKNIFINLNILKRLLNKTLLSKNVNKRQIPLTWIIDIIDSLLIGSVKIYICLQFKNSIESVIYFFWAVIKKRNLEFLRFPFYNYIHILSCSEAKRRLQVILQRKDSKCDYECPENDDIEKKILERSL